MSNKKKHLAVIFSDWHIHDYKRFSKDGDRLGWCLKVLEDIGKFCNKHDIRTVLFAGDMFDTQKVLGTRVVNETVAAFARFAEFNKQITIYAITGNHDQSTKNLIDNEAVSALRHIETVADNFIVIDNNTVLLKDGITISGIPYYEYKEHYALKLEERVEEVEPNRQKGYKNYLMIHQTPEGIGNPMIPTDTNPKDMAYMTFDHTFCGHIHHRREITDNFTLVGNPLHRDLADAGKKKGFLVMNLLAPENGHKFIQLKGYPEFVRAYEDEEIDEENKYVVREPRLDNLKQTEQANVEEFNTSVSPAELMENYWKEVDGEDEELLKIGLGFLK